MGVLDFLFQGSPPPSTTTYGETVQGIPQFMTDYTQGLLSRANAIAAEPYQPYGGPRLAQFNPDQTRAFNLTEQSVGKYAPAMQTAMNLTTGAAGKSAFGAAQPYMGAAAGSSLTAAQPYMNAATRSAMGAAQPYMRAASGSSLTAAQPYMGVAAQSAPSMVGRYMNPYEDMVVGRIGELAGRNLQENLMPAINRNFIRAGQYGSSAMQGATGKALRDTQESALAQQGALLNQGYGQATSAAQADLSRIAGLGQTAGNLSSADLSRLASLGQLAGNISESDLSRIANMGQLAGNLSSADLSRMANLGQLAGNLTTQDINAMLSAGSQMGTLGQQAQSMNLKDIAALEAAGQTQQGQAQKSLDIAYQDFLKQRSYPQDQLAMMNALIRGLPYGSTTSTQSTGPANYYSPSPLAQIAGAGALLSGYKKGGKVRNPNRRSSRGRKRG